ncbi:MAG: hypothetical protein MUF07_02000 [Steroidobacteraceae bacterium]|jgi:hypothetical protein|nr:hypothetical protein [Steroidobacteraceae bacterium]
MKKPPSVCHYGCSALLAAALAGPVALAQSPQPAAPVPAAGAAPSRDPEPAVETSARAPAARRDAPTPTAAPTRAAATAPGDPAPTRAAAVRDQSTARRATRAMDRVDLESSQITGNRELPRVLYIVPWRAPAAGDLEGRPVNSLLYELTRPVDRDVFRRENRYFDALQAQSPGADGGPPAADGPEK